MEEVVGTLDVIMPNMETSLLPSPSLQVDFGHKLVLLIHLQLVETSI